MNADESSDLVILPYDRDVEQMAATLEGGVARVSVYTCKVMAAVLGRGSKPEVELNMDAVRADALPVYKRPGGGCAVLLDPGNVIVSVSLPLPGIGGLKGAFAALSDWVIAGLAACGIDGVEQKGISDLAIGDRKVGGACLYRRRDLAYYSTTLLVEPDLAAVERYLAHPPREPEYRRGRSHGEFMGVLPAGDQELDAARLADRLDGILHPPELQL